jgi:hypothetical protein
MQNKNELKHLLLATLVALAIGTLVLYAIFWEKIDFEPAKIISITAKSEKALNNRSELSGLLNEFGYKTMIEVGVLEGDLACELLQSWPRFEHYYDVDPYEWQVNYGVALNRNKNEQDKLFSRASRRLTTKFGTERIAMMRNYSTKAAGAFRTKSIDFIYIDARHDYCGASADLDAFYPILRCGGLFAGHDYVTTSNGRLHDWALCANGSRIEGSVKRAVLEFAQRNEEM